MSQWALHCENPEGGRREFVLERPRYTVGRGSADGELDHLSVTGDSLVSRQHFEVIQDPQGVLVRRLPSGRNPIFYQGQECDEFRLPPGEVFVVGQTRCTLARSEAALATVLNEFTLMGPGRDQARQRSSYECFQALMQMLPELRRASDIGTVWSTALGVLRTLLPEASTLMVLDGERVIESIPPGSPVVASKRLIARAHQQKCTITHCWDDTTASEATVLEQVSWAVAAPAEQNTLYAVGSANPQDLEGKAVLIDVVAETVAHYLALQQFQRLQSQVGQFFSPVLRRLLSEQDFREVLKPRRAEVTVLFFDLRGFSMATEAADGDSLDEILRHHETLTNVMTEITECIFAREGVVIDYQGDAILACWGAPHARPDHALQAVEAARAILARVYAMDLPFNMQKGGRNLRCGLGLGSGEVIAGQIGARDQTKFGIMGKVVNQASRLEGLTKQLGVPMLINAELFRHLPEGQVHCRCVGKVRPAGVREASEIYEVVVGADQGGSGLKLEESAAYAGAYQAYCQGDFRSALQHLREVPLEDPIGSFLMRQVLNRQEEDLPAAWDGVLEFRSK
jgi:adenylate cyclase